MEAGVVELGCLMVADLGVMGAQGYLQSTIVGDPRRQLVLAS